jgi:hypothetical protein
MPQYGIVKHGKKLCRTCQTYLPLMSFPKRKDSRSGKHYRSSPCVECRRWRDQLYTRENLERRRAQWRASRKRRYRNDPEVRAKALAYDKVYKARRRAERVAV